MIGGWCGNGHVISGDSHDANDNHGSTNDEQGYNMTIAMLYGTGCWIDGSTVLNPLPKNLEFNCTGLLYSIYGFCNYIFFSHFFFGVG